MSKHTTDRELLELAAKAAGWTVVRWTDDDTALLLEGIQQPFNALHENPHSDCMGDALRLAVKLGIDVEWRSDGRVAAYRHANANGYCFTAFESSREDRAASVRRAIVRAAAEIGKNGGES